MDHALSGVRVLDFSHLLQGPFATQMLGDMGADIIKIEKTGSGDLMRKLTFLNYRIGGVETPCYMAWNRNKRSLTLDLKKLEAREIVYRIAKQCDVVVENFRPGVMDKLGLGYNDLKAVNSRIIYCSASGYGQDGPYSHLPGQDLLLQSLTGITMVTGRGDSPPMPLGTSIADQLGAYHIVQGILAALYYREKTGKGQKVEINLYQCMLAHQTQEFVTVLNMGRDFERPLSGIGHVGMPAPFGIYQTADGWISIAINPISEIADILEDPGLLEMADPQTLYEQRDAIFERIQSVLIKKPTSYWLAKMRERDLWVSEVKSYSQVANDPQAIHLQAFTSFRHPHAGDVKTVSPPIKFSETPCSIRRHPPMLGEQSREILIEYGYSEEEIEQFQQNHVI